jgi:hypothetical protein
MIGRQHRFVGVGFREAQHVYMPGLVIAWHLSLYQHFMGALKQSSALLVKIQWPAQEDCDGAMCFSYQGASLEIVFLFFCMSCDSM